MIGAATERNLAGAAPPPRPAKIRNLHSDGAQKCHKFACGRQPSGQRWGAAPHAYFHCVYVPSARSHPNMRSGRVRSPKATVRQHSHRTGGEETEPLGVQAEAAKTRAMEAKKKEQRWRENPRRREAAERGPSQARQRA